MCVMCMQGLRVHVCVVHAGVKVQMSVVCMQGVVVQVCVVCMQDLTA
jgi:hypothetical protein